MRITQTYKQLEPHQLIKLINGSVDPITVAKLELASRGLDGNGRYIGYLEAHREHFPDGSPIINEREDL